MKQLSLLVDNESEWTNDDWETPSKIAQMMANLVKPSEHKILEPCAGSGQIVRQLELLENREIAAIEINRYRFSKGSESSKSFWVNDDFLAPSAPFYLDDFDLIITNPPFSKCVEFISRGLQLLNPRKAKSRLLFLMPLDWNCTLKNAVSWSKLNAHIHHIYCHKGRIGYLDKNGKQQNNRQCCDAVFDIRLGKRDSASTYLGEASENRSSIPLYFPQDPPF